MEPKFFYVDDDTAILFAANGTALTALLVGLPDIIPLYKAPLPTYPIWIYFCGLVLAFIAKLIIQLLNSDLRQREKLSHARTFIIATRESSDLTEELSKQMDATWEHLARRHQGLLKEGSIPLWEVARAWLFFASATCFLIATASLILLVREIGPPG